MFLALLQKLRTSFTGANPQTSQPPTPSEPAATAAPDIPEPEAPTAEQTAFLDRLVDFGLLTESAKPYMLTHFARYQATLDLIDLGNTAAPRILELGGESLVFTLLLKTRFPNAEIVVNTYQNESDSTERSAHNPATGETLTCQAASFNIEQDPWPFPDASFDLVVCMEILEHLLLDPCHAFREASRVLRWGGDLLVTTPNIASYEAMQKLLELDSPYLFGVYSRHGAYGRHNREYTPWEVAALGDAAGLDQQAMCTLDVYPPSRDASLARALIEQHAPAHQHLRNQNIFYRARKLDRPWGPYPSALFDQDPSLHRARIAIELATDPLHAKGPLLGEASITNTGGYTWTPEGPNRTRLRIALATPQGRLIARDFRKIALPHPLEPGASLRLAFDTQAPAEPGRYQLLFDMVHEQVCWFAEGRPWPVTIPVTVAAIT